VHGCFWHRHPGCPYAATPKTRFEFWDKKFCSNVIRDAQQVRTLLKRNWRVMIVWECALRTHARQSTFDAVVKWLKGSDSHAEIPSKKSRH
jgi:DNA mismatch endonuclease (patch repair protein)